MKRIIMSIVLLLAAGSARAEIICGVTLEWLADTCPYVAIYSAQIVSPDAPGQAHISATLAESLRGEPPKTFSFDYPTFDAASQKSAHTPAVGDKFLIFLRDADTRPKEVRWEHIISLTHPSTRGWAHVAVRPDFTVLTDGDQIAKIVRERIAKKTVVPTLWREYPRDRFRVEVPMGTPAFDSLFSGSTCYLIVPDDLLEVAKKHEKQ